MKFHDKGDKMPFQNLLTRREVLASSIVIAAAALLPGPLRAQVTWPDRPIKIVVPYAAGGSTDVIARFVANKLTERLGQPVIVENKPGANGILATSYVARQRPDGYTLLLAGTTLVTAPLISFSNKKPPYDPVKDLQPIGQIGGAPFMVVISNELKAANLRELIDLAQAKPQSINYGSGGIGSLNHLGVELIASATKIKLTHVPYSGIAPAFADLLGGNLQMSLVSLPTALPHLRSGRIRALAITSAQRSPLAPQVPTVSEAGVPGFQFYAWYGLTGPAGLPAQVLKRLNTELNTVLGSADAIELLARDGTAPRTSSPEDFGNLINSEVGAWQQLIKQANIASE
ncbi:tripartite tricarboxylate transporter substrate binding protein [Noviherbaspirillum sedimenti]|uniref:Tripartite tricarboxylate transporter substrate binding protein n=1 Tax=Noviherbaspirillum sedimenti TaxID=2320865 RepID=A0A3A3G456_9BURK|nr:tripartite tricarboxylate transporter substrate binding protein [Noviherbaspirillum sedimenti]RJG03258.1 tripartite tricarboxylate transporter substrate binding protein [Noviherbaspirillum sedimenti]